MAAIGHDASVRYQDLKIRDAGRLAAIAGGLALTVGLSMAFRQKVEPLINLIPDRSHAPFLPLMFAFVLVAILSGGMAIYYLLSSPAQNAEFLARMAAKDRNPSSKFDPSLLDPLDPDFDVRTWDYLKRRLKADR